MSNVLVCAENNLNGDLNVQLRANLYLSSSTHKLQPKSLRPVEIKKRASAEATARARATGCARTLAQNAARYVAAADDATTEDRNVDCD